jgi:hypothetical protein
MLSISYIKRNAIDPVKWDACIDNASNGNIYAHADYLDCMAENWDALIADGYRYVMPLTWNRKYGFNYLYQPPFTASLGVFGIQIDQEIVNGFLKAIPAKFRLVEISLNAGNPVDESYPGIYYRANYILDLSSPYDMLRGLFRQNILRNSQKALHAGCRYEKEISLGQVIQLAKEAMKSLAPLPLDAYQRFEKLYHHLHQQRKAITRGVYTNNGQLVASAVFFFSNARAYYIIVGNHPNGKTMGASHFLIDSFIQEFAESQLILDFEGSDIHGLAFFYSSFGAAIEKYPAIKWNRLPWWVRWMKS